MSLLTRLSYGGTAAIVTSMGLIVGLGEATTSRATVLSGLLLVAFADNLTDSLAIHTYQESEHLESRQAFRSTVSNFLVRLLVASSFVALAWVLPIRLLIPIAVAWGMVLLGTLTFWVARGRGAPPAPEVAKHLAAAVVVIVISRLVATWIVAHFS